MGLTNLRSTYADFVRKVTTLNEKKESPRKNNGKATVAPLPPKNTVDKPITKSKGAGAVAPNKKCKGGGIKITIAWA